MSSTQSVNPALESNRSQRESFQQARSVAEDQGFIFLIWEVYWMRCPIMLIL